MALAVFLVEFSTSSFETLPNLPWTLVGLTSVSAGGYVGKRLAEDQAPLLTALSPDGAASGEWVTIRGRNLVITNPDGTDVRPEKVKFGGREAMHRQNSTASRVEAKVPRDLKPGETVEVKVLRSDGVETEGLDFRVTGGPSIVSVRPARIVLESAGGRFGGRRENASDTKIIISGRGFGEDDGRGAAAVLLDGRPLEVTDRGWRHDIIQAKLPSFERAEREGYEVPGTAELVVHDADGRPSKPYSVTLARSRQGR